MPDTPQEQADAAAVQKDTILADAEPNKSFKVYGAEAARQDLDALDRVEDRANAKAKRRRWGMMISADVRGSN